MLNKTNGSLTNSSNKTSIDIQTILRWISVTELCGIVIFNLLVIALLSVRKRNSRMSFFVRNLATADLSVGIVYLLPDIVIYYFGVGFVSEVSCYVYLSVRNIPVYASTFAIIVLTLDRLYVVIRPIKSATSGTKYKIFSAAATWGLPVIFSTPYYNLNVHSVYKCHYAYDMTWTKIIFIYDGLVNIVFPLMIMVVCYTVIVMTICRKQTATVMKSYQTELLETRRSVTESFRSDRSNFFAKAKIRSIKLLLVVIMAYAICWTPVSIGASLKMWKLIELGYEYKLLFVLAPLNSLVNPLVFLLFNLDLLKFKPPVKHNTLSMTRSTSSRRYSSASSKLGLRKTSSH